MIKKIYKKFLNTVLAIFNLFYIPHLLSHCCKKLNQLPKETQLFLMTRMDFGTFIYLLYYAECWEKKRGKTCVVVLNSEYEKVKELAAHITPDTLLIDPASIWLKGAIWFLGKHRVYEKTLRKVYAQLLELYPHALRIFDPTPRSSYILSFDKRLERVSASTPKPFIEAYKDIRFALNYFEPGLQDLFHLHHQRELTRRELCLHELAILKKELKIGEDFIVMNLNCKRYKEKGAYRRTIHFPDRYNVLIDSLIEKGFSVVIQGREEQPYFSPRKGLIDYSKSPFISIPADIALYSGAKFTIINKTGPDVYAMACNIPNLGLNFAELSTINPVAKLRFFPKHVFHKKKNRFLTWKEFLQSPCFFDVANYNYDPDIEWHDLNEEEMLTALEEFLPLAIKDEKWFEYSPLQQEFRSHLHPLHLDLYDVKGVPCDAYLRGA